MRRENKMARGERERERLGRILLLNEDGADDSGKQWIDGSRYR